VAVLVIGLGSMGRRRLRVLKSLNIHDLFVYDTDPNRVESARVNFGAEFLDPVTAIGLTKPLELVLVSTPPDAHAHYMEAFAKAGVPVFVEASVTELDQLKSILKDGSIDSNLIFPSITMMFFDFTELVRTLAPKIGEIYIMTYHVGQNVYDWHPWEDPLDYYVSNRETGACRELIPFELGWIKSVFGDFKLTKSTILNEGLPSLEIASAYCLGLEFANGPKLASIVVDVLASPKPVRVLRLIGSEGTLVFDADHNHIALKTKDNHELIPLPTLAGEGEGVNPDLPYKAELEACIQAIKSGNRGHFPNTLAEDIEILEFLEEAEVINNAS